MLYTGVLTFYLYVILMSLENIVNFLKTEYMKHFILLLLSTGLFFSCTPDKKTTDLEVETPEKMMLSERPWNIDYVYWTFKDINGSVSVRLTTDSLSECQKEDPYKFNDWIVTIPYEAHRTCPDSVVAESGTFKMSKDATRFKTSFMYPLVDSGFAFDVIELTDTKFHIKTNPGDIHTNRGHEIEFIFTR